MSDAESVARAALAEITPSSTVGVLLASADDDGVSTLTFLADLSGYPGWNWSVSVAQLPGQEPTVLEAELLPGPGALLAPDWVPWAERLEEYRAAQAAAAAEAGESDDADSEDDDDVEDDDDSEDDIDDDGFDEVDDDVLSVPASRVDEQDEAEDEPDDDGPEPPDAA